MGHKVYLAPQPHIPSWRVALWMNREMSYYKREPTPPTALPTVHRTGLLLWPWALSYSPCVYNVSCLQCLAHAIRNTLSHKHPNSVRQCALLQGAHALLICLHSALWRPETTHCQLPKCHLFDLTLVKRLNRMDHLHCYLHSTKRTCLASSSN